MRLGVFVYDCGRSAGRLSDYDGRDRHSVADILNQTLMYVALRRGIKQPDRQHPFGYGKKRFFGR
jgi:hypothetical protein